MEEEPEPEYCLEQVDSPIFEYHFVVIVVQSNIGRKKSYVLLFRNNINMYLNAAIYTKCR